MSVNRRAWALASSAFAASMAEAVFSVRPAFLRAASIRVIAASNLLVSAFADGASAGAVGCSTAFGASAAFGASTAFGASAAFGASTAFGASAGAVGCSTAFGVSAAFGASADAAGCSVVGVATVGWAVSVDSWALDESTWFPTAEIVCESDAVVDDTGVSALTVAAPPSII